jgi:integrase
VAREPGIYRPRYRDKTTGEWKRSAVWWITWTGPEGSRHRESSGSEHREKAVKLRRSRLHAADQGGPLEVLQRTTYEDLAALVEVDYTRNARRSLKRIRGSLAHLEPTFRGLLAREITEDRIERYVEARKAAGAANGTINRELATLKRAFRLARRLKRVASVPEISLLAEAKPRTGFFDRPDFERLLGHLPEDVRPALQVAYITGWRLASEVLTRQLRHVDFGPAVWQCGCEQERRDASCARCGASKPGWLRLDPGETKNGEGRMFPLTPELRGILEHQRARTEEFQRQTERIVPHVFHRRGEPIRSIQKVWNAATTAAGLQGRIPHDLRRTAVRNLERAGVPRSAAMAMVGHKTESMYRRYAITDEAMLREAADKLAAYHRAESVKVASKSGAGGASEAPAEVAVYEVNALEAASGFEPENRGFAGDDRVLDQVDRVRPTRHGLHEYNTLHASLTPTTPTASNLIDSVWGKVGASGPCWLCRSRPRPRSAACGPSLRAGPA